MSDYAEVLLWGRRIGAVSLDQGTSAAVFQYTPEFARSGIEVSPLRMPLGEAPYSFPELGQKAFKGLPGLLADSLPDKYGNALFDAWLAAQGRAPDEVNAIERLGYTGTRGMGALEFAPLRGPRGAPARDIEIGRLVALASEVLTERERFVTDLREGGEKDALRDILSVGTSAGGARAKAVIAWNQDSSEIRSGQVDADPGFEHWLLKFDGVEEDGERESLEAPEGYGAIEYAYSLMARAAGIEMADCTLIEENERRHFVTRRFDRPTAKTKLHMQSLAALAHYDFNRAGDYSYEQALLTIRRLGLPMAAIEQQFRRMVFNVFARNQDDHVKNIAFLMDQRGGWSLSPAFDVTYAYKSDGRWTDQHQMTINGKRDGFTLEDFELCAESASMRRGRAMEIVEEVRAAVADWPRHAEDARLGGRDMERIRQVHRHDMARS